MKADCIFCSLPRKRIAENHHMFAVEDSYPVTPQHVLIISKDHKTDWFDLDNQEKSCLSALIEIVSKKLKKEDPTIKGFNIGMNCGEEAGQTIMHFHCHLIPRREGDMENPRGGVRHVIPGKGSYD